LHPRPPQSHVAKVAVRDVSIAVDPVTVSKNATDVWAATMRLTVHNLGVTVPAFGLEIQLDGYVMQAAGGFDDCNASQPGTNGWGTLCDGPLAAGQTRTFSIGTTYAQANAVPTSSTGRAWVNPMEWPSWARLDDANERNNTTTFKAAPTG
jgi:hypothetical protein